MAAPKRVLRRNFSQIIMPISAGSTSFADQLRAKAADVGHTPLQMVIQDIMNMCKGAAALGEHEKSSCYLSFVGDVELVRIELELLDLQVKRLDKSSSALCWSVSWSPDEVPAKKMKVVTGNVNMKCGVCMTDGLVQRLHPCGHLLGACCLASMVSKKCPFCREEVRISQVVFQP